MTSEPHGEDLARKLRAENSEVVNAAVAKSRRFGFICIGLTIVGIGGLALLGLDPYGWRTGATPLYITVNAVTYLLLGTSAGASFGAAYSWKLAQGVIDRLGKLGSDALETIQSELAAVHEEFHEHVLRNLPPGLTPQTAVMITPRLLEICHTLDVAAMRKEIRTADGTAFDTDQAALLGIHVLRVGHPDFSIDEKAASQQWLAEHNIMPSEIETALRERHTSKLN